MFPFKNFMALIQNKKNMDSYQINEIVNIDENKEGQNTYSSLYGSCHNSKTDKIFQFFTNIQDHIISVSLIQAI